MLLLRQSTAVTISFGPAVLNTDGVTLVTNLTGTGSNQTENTSTGIRLSKNGGAFAARHATAGASTYDAFGNYLVPLDTTDTNTLGTLRMQYANAAAFCPIFQDFMVINTALWDALAAASGGAIPNLAAGASGGLPLGVDNSGRVDVLKINGTSQTARDIGASVLLSAGSGTGQLDFTSGVVKSNLAQILGTALTETAGLLAGGFKKFFNIAGPAATMDHGVLVDAVTTTTTATNLTTNNDKTGYGLSAAAVQAIWDALTSALTTAGSIGKRLVDFITTLVYSAPPDPAFYTTARGTKLDNLDAAITTRTKPADTQARVTLTDTVTTYTGNTLQTGDTYAALTGTQAEPGQGAPAANASPLAKLSYIFKAWRNRNTQTATAYKLYNDDATTVDQKATYSDDGTTADRGEIGTGP